MTGLVPGETTAIFTALDGSGATATATIVVREMGLAGALVEASPRFIGSCSDRICRPRVTIEFDANGGTAPNPSYIRVRYRDYYELATTNRAGHEFNGWWTSRTGGERVTENTQVRNSSGHTLFARWTPLPHITVNSTGLTNLQVGQPVTGSIVFTLSNGTFVNANILTISDFTVRNLPPDLIAGTAVRMSNTVVTVPITGTPTTHNANTKAIELPSTIAATNIANTTSVVTVSGTVTASAVARGDGAVVSIPIVSGTPTHNSITVNAVTIANNPGNQVVVYAISTSTTVPTTGWQLETTFAGLSAYTTYYVFARAAQSANWNAGVAQRSEGIRTAPILVTGVSISGGNRIMITGEQIQLSAAVAPANATNRAVTWSSSDLAVASVSEATGEVLAIKPGNTTITATTVDGGFTAQITVTVPFRVTVVNGTGGGYFMDGDTVHISATVPGHLEFVGWTAEPNNVLVADRYAQDTSFVMPVSDVTVTANIVGEVTIIFRGNGHTSGEVPEHQIFSTPGTIKLAYPGTMTRTGYVFVGWRCPWTQEILRTGEYFSWDRATTDTWDFNAEWIFDEAGILRRAIETSGVDINDTLIQALIDEIRAQELGNLTLLERELLNRDIHDDVIANLLYGLINHLPSTELFEVLELVDNLSSFATLQHLDELPEEWGIIHELVRALQYMAIYFTRIMDDIVEEITSLLDVDSDTADSIMRWVMAYYMLHFNSLNRLNTFDEPSAIIQLPFRSFLRYTYDGNGNILTIRFYTGELIVKYAYDDQKRLIREDNAWTRETVVHHYDDNTGSPALTTRHAFTLDELCLATFPATWRQEFVFNHGRLNFHQMVSSRRANPFLQSAVNYDNDGNVTQFNGYVFAWNGGRLTSVTHRATGMVVARYYYNEFGFYRKTVVNRGRSNTTTTLTHHPDGRLESQCDGTDTIYFIYNASGNMIGFTLDGTDFYYIRNRMGDVVGITDINGHLVARYIYTDAWGIAYARTICEEILEQYGCIASINPIRFRGHFFNQTTGLYYMNGQWYCPRLRSFICASDDNVFEISPQWYNGMIERISSALLLILGQ